ncbi:lysyl-tRNA synthetase family protein [Rhodopirellula maiorica SM1]|uniref:Lysyl-tRNA synthetase family protein n=1 Tax=Rhodopirellula maiorica SM1 TaxID=1265738 RepID=M5RPR3_9BACT|nr:EF-P lysine aminoacylase EpmA [Rhodopirellula maiorica]EMI15959.1 lysyl-tRNA synthetase family protein [Rhodopirellula maiorica SM1]
MSHHSRCNIDHIRARARLLRQVRAFFDERNFFEVQPPCLSRDCIVDPYINPLTIATQQLALAEPDLPECFYLQTSPELAMKRMLAAGAPSIYSIGPVFRAGERGPLHNIEFTMLEWYDVGADISSGINTTGTLACEVFETARFDVTTYRDAFSEALKMDPITAPLTRLQSETADIDVLLAKDIAKDRDAMLDVLFTHHVQPKLGGEVPVIVRNYPLTQAALARQAADDEQCAARFEMFFKGVELANGYDELLDADELIERTRANNQRRIACGESALPVDNTLLDAMRRGLPASTGVALGFDRLLMLHLKSTSIDKVVPLTIEIA